jgi:predicted O-linked N-acetylglucosamine transferase (SPINDLY family)
VVALDPSSRHTHSALLNALLHHPDSTPETILEEHMRWARTHCGPARPRDFTNSRDVNRKLRIGYISGEATSAQTFCFMSPIIKNHDRSRFEVVYYNAQPHHNERTGEYQRWVAGWREVAGLTETEQADLVRGGRIDIFADLSGHYGYSALPVAAMRVAPVQVAFPNYPSTTGVAEIDYMFTDRWTSPAECEKHYAERLYRVPSGYLAYAPPACAPAVSELPALRSGAVTFGFFQRASKLNAGVYDAIARVLHGVPRSRLLVHFSSVDLDEEGSGMRSRIAGALAARGIAAGRIEFAGSRGLDRSLALMGEADIALDSFPYNGQTTTCECLWMGVPVVTLAGGAHAGRVGAALLSRVGLPGWVAAGVADYVEIASRAAADLPALAVLRAGLRDRVAASSLADGPRICREIEDAYRWMWKCWCLEPAGGNECQTTAK